MIRVTQLKVHIDENLEVLKEKIRKKCKLSMEVPFTYHIHRKNIDARDKNNIYFVYTVDVSCPLEKSVLKRKHKDITKVLSSSKPTLIKGIRQIDTPPVVVGFGPAGMFCALTLAQQGYCPIVLERGQDVDARSATVDCFFKGGPLDENSNIQFGEGGAGTFSDGKLTARSKDPLVHTLYETLIRFGAPKEIEYESFPHVGSDKLKSIIKNIRQEILRLGGEIHFDTKVESLLVENGSVRGVRTNTQTYHASHVVLALGNSARDSVKSFYEQGLAMQSKPFAVGLRIEHTQQFINARLYHEYATHPALHGGNYRLTHQCSNGKGAYTFCMCPGGTVVAATSVAGRVVVNGMSNYSRDEVNANSAILVQIDVRDYGEGVFDGMHYIDAIEEKAFLMGGSNYQAPCQRVNDYLDNKKSTALGAVTPSYPRGVAMANLNDLFSPSINAALKEGLHAFDQKIKGFCGPDAIVTGVETRSSSPVRIERQKDSFESISITGIYPCGEGAGYAGGIVSSAIDGMKCAQQIIQICIYEA